MSHQWVSPHHPLPIPPFLPTPPPRLIVGGYKRRPGSGLLTCVSPSSLQLPCPYALTQAGRDSLACTLHLHAAPPPQNNRPSGVMRHRYDETLRACCGCVCSCCSSVWSAFFIFFIFFLLPKTNFLCADVSLYLNLQLVRPVTVVPNVPGIPGPPSPQPQTQPVQSEAKLVLINSSFISHVMSIYIVCLFVFLSIRPKGRVNLTVREQMLFLTS